MMTGVVIDSIDVKRDVFCGQNRILVSFIEISARVQEITTFYLTG
jgi:hypothetical protein